MRGDFDVYPEEGVLIYGPIFYLVSNFFWESEIGIQLLGEYYFHYGQDLRIHTGIDDTVWAEWGEHIAGLAIRLTKLFSNDWKTRDQVATSF